MKKPEKFEYNRKDKKFPASTNYNKHYEAPVTKYESVQRYQDSAQKGYYNKITRNTQITMLPSIYAQANYSKSQKFKEPPKETCTLIVKEGLRTKEIFFGKVKITALIDSGSTVSLLRENTSRRIMDPTKLLKNKMLLTGIGEAQVTTIGSNRLIIHHFSLRQQLGVISTAIRRAISLPEILILHRQHALYYSDTPITSTSISAHVLPYITLLNLLLVFLSALPLRSADMLIFRLRP
ncbi:peptidase A2 domain-containing protein [Trichonephila clavipes]|nr:peptidase A2 domain-containing protein [Trichonephila clavipes]